MNHFFDQQKFIFIEIFSDTWPKFVVGRSFDDFLGRTSNNKYLAIGRFVRNSIDATCYYLCIHVSINSVPKFTLHQKYSEVLTLILNKQTIFLVLLSVVVPVL